MSSSQMNAMVGCGQRGNRTNLGMGQKSNAYDPMSTLFFCRRKKSRTKKTQALNMVKFGQCMGLPIFIFSYPAMPYVKPVEHSASTLPRDDVCEPNPFSLFGMIGAHPSQPKTKCYYCCDARRRSGVTVQW